MKFSKLLFCCYKKDKINKNNFEHKNDNNNNDTDNDINNNSNQPIKWNDTVPFKIPVTGGYVLKVYDGDTITIASKLPFENSPMYRFSVRLAGIDTPEIKGKTEKEKNMAKEAKSILETMILGKWILLKNIKSEKYGRILADIYLDNIHINKWMIDQNLAIEYDGGKKKIWN
jgi:endonuclease YncB( thermonuclease family)